MVHAYVRPDGLAAVAISDHEYQYRVAHNMLNKVGGTSLVPLRVSKVVSGVIFTLCEGSSVVFFRLSRTFSVT